MPVTVKVYPTKRTAVGLKHPHGPVLLITGSLWPQDSFTARRLTDGAVTKDASKVYVPPVAPASPPAASAPTATATKPTASEQLSTTPTPTAPTAPAAGTTAAPAEPATSTAAPKTA